MSVRARRVGIAGAAGSLLLGALMSAPGAIAGTARPATARQATARQATARRGALVPLPAPRRLAPFVAAGPQAGTWRAAGRRVGGHVALYTTSLVPPGGTQPAGIAWMDMRLLSARLYSGSLSPGGGPYTYTAPIAPAQAATLVAAFNGGFQMKDAHGGYLTEGRVVVPLRRGAASIVISSDGSVQIGTWGGDVGPHRGIASVRQNLVLLVADGRPTTAAATPHWLAWGNTCGATSCAPAAGSIERQWRSGLGITASGALVYVYGPALAPLQLADLLARAGARRALELDINPDWPDFASYAAGGGPANPGNGVALLPGSVQGPWTFFESFWARDFITLSARAGG